MLLLGLQHWAVTWLLGIDNHPRPSHLLLLFTTGILVLRLTAPLLPEPELPPGKL